MDTKTKQFRITHWLQVMDAQAQSGLNKEQWCKRQGISRNQFFYWQKVIRQMAHAGELPGEMVSSEKEAAFFELIPGSLPENICRERTDMVSCEPVPCPPLPPEKPGLSVSYGRFTVNIYNESIRGSTLAKVLKAVADAD